MCQGAVYKDSNGTNNAYDTKNYEQFMITYALWQYKNEIVTSPLQTT